MTRQMQHAVREQRSAEAASKHVEAVKAAQAAQARSVAAVKAGSKGGASQPNHWGHSYGCWRVRSGNPPH